MAVLSFTTASVVPSRDSPVWRIVITNIDAADFQVFTTLNRIAADRVVTPLLNAPLIAECTVPSDNAKVWIPAPDPDGDPWVSEGNRLAYWLRRESETAPFYTVRAAVLLQQVEDAARQDDARTKLVGYDPWRYLFSRPCVNADGDLPGPKGMSWTDTPGSTIALQLLENTIDAHGDCYIGFDGDVDDTIELAEFNVPQGMSVGQAWQMLCATQTMDIVLTPVFDPLARPAILVDLNIMAQAGASKPAQVFAWDMPGRSLSEITRLQDGTGRANKVKFFASQGGQVEGGSDIPVKTDAASVARYREYWAQQFFPGQVRPAAVEALAEYQLSLRKIGRETISIAPTPERAPRPFQDYGLGDRVPVWASPQRFREYLGANDGEEQFLRIYGFPIQISDDGVEQVAGMIVSPQGFTEA